MNNTQKPQHTLHLTIDKEQILNIIYAESAWYCILHPEAKPLSPDVERLCMMRVKEGFEELKQHFMAYIYFSNFNPNLPKGNITLELRFFNPIPDMLEEMVHEDVAQMLAWWALKRFYGDDASYYHTAWLKHRSSLMMNFVRDANYNLIKEMGL
ncbi:MAG: hypothetical protein Q4B68_08260 [Bacteroidales bacterium]|nr:hypothetical protein [Bacteroidales bacterium]